MEPEAEPFAEDLPPAFADRWPTLSDAAIDALEMAWQAVGEAERSLLHKANAMAMRRDAADFAAQANEAGVDYDGTPPVTEDEEAAYRAERAGLLIACSLAVSQAVTAIGAMEALTLALPGDPSPLPDADQA